jgi:hypothetical protein
MRWAEHVKRMEMGKVSSKCWLENLKGRNHWEVKVVSGRTLLEWMHLAQGSYLSRKALLRGVSYMHACPKQNI